MTDRRTDTGDGRVRAALHGLADGPVPDGLADKAIAGVARRHRRFGAGVGIGVVALAAAVAIPGMVHQGPSIKDTSQGPATGSASGSTGTSTAPGGSAAGGGLRLKPVAAVVPQGGECVARPIPPMRIKEVARTDWPDFVRAVVTALPARPDYVMQSGYSWCAYPDAEANAYAVVNLGHSREHGHLTVNMYIEAARVPTSCAEVARLAPPWHVEFCDPATGAAPMAYGLSYQGNSLVGAIYADGHAVVIEAIGDGEQANPITGSQLRAAVTAAAVHDVIPDAAAPGQ